MRCSDRPRPATADHWLPAEQARRGFDLAGMLIIDLGVARFVARNGVNERALLGTVNGLTRADVLGEHGVGDERISRNS